MKVRLATASDRDAWDRHVAASPNGHYHQLYGWGEARALVGWEPLRVLAEEEGIRGVLQLGSRRLPGTRLRLFYAPRGPALAAGAGPEVCAALLDAAADAAAARGGVLLRLDPEPAEWSAPVAAWLPECGFRRLAQTWSYWNWASYSLRLDVSRSEEEMLASLDRQKRQHLRRAEKAGVRIAESTCRDDLAVLHRLTGFAAERNNSQQHSLGYFQTCWDELLARGFGHLLFAYHEGVPVASSFVITVGKRAWATYGAPDPAARKLFAYEAIFWGLMREFHARGFAWLDIGTTSGATPGEPGDKHFAFKKAFGPQVVRYPGYFDRPLRPLAYRACRFAETRGLPAAERAMTRGREVLARLRPRKGALEESEGE